MSSLLKKLLIILVILVLVFIAYMVISGQSPAAPDSLSARDEIKNREGDIAIIVNQMQELKTYDVSGTFFSNTAFLSLENHRKNLGEEPTGRANPFAPVQ